MFPWGWCFVTRLSLHISRYEIVPDASKTQYCLHFSVSPPTVQEPRLSFLQLHRLQRLVGNCEEPACELLIHLHIQCQLPGESGCLWPKVRPLLSVRLTLSSAPHLTHTETLLCPQGGHHPREERELRLIWKSAVPQLLLCKCSLPPSFSPSPFTGFSLRAEGKKKKGCCSWLVCVMEHITSL